MTKMNTSKLNAVLARHGALCVPEVHEAPNLGSFIDRWSGGLVQFFVERNAFNEDHPKFAQWVTSFKLHHDK